jgi:hypothetical protein
MSWLPTGKRGAVALAILFSLALWGGAFSLDVFYSNRLQQLPITANIIAGIVLLPADLVVIYGLVDYLLARQRQRRWSTVLGELTSAIGDRWTHLHRLLVRRYALNNVADSHRKIARAEEIWTELSNQEEEVPEELRGTELAHWRLPNDAADRLAEIHELWAHMSGPGAETEELTLESRLTNVLLPRLSPEDPHLTAAVRRLIDAIEDLTELRSLVSRQGDPFPMSPFADGPGTAGRQILAHGSPNPHRETLRMLRQLLDAAQQVVRCGQDLQTLLTRDHPG